jgi:uncharacterized protein (DUF427 family)
MKATWNGHVIAESDATVVVEGNHCFPLDAVDPAAAEIADRGGVLALGRGDAFVKGRRA